MNEFFNLIKKEGSQAFTAEEIIDCFKNFMIKLDSSKTFALLAEKL
jgi:hypothetical protein